MPFPAGTRTPRGQFFFDFTTDVITAETTLYAKWTEVTQGSHVVSFNTDSDGSFVPTQVVEDGQSPTTPSAPTRDGFQFDGWYKDAERTVPFDFTADVITGDTTIYAKWTEVEDGKNTVIFNVNGGSATDSQQVDDGQLPQKPADPTRSGYTFVGWYKDLFHQEVFDFTSDVITEDTTIYAKWQVYSANSIIISFDTGEGSPVSSVTVVSGQLLQEPSEPTRTGYNFYGWYKDSAFTNPYNFQETVTAVFTLHAKWTAHPASGSTVSFDAGIGSSTTIAPQMVASGSTVREPTATVKHGYKLEGWYTEPEFTNKFDFAADTVSADTILYAKWSVNSIPRYFVLFDTDEGASAIDPKSVWEGETIEEPEDPVKASHTLEGWFTEPEFTNRFDFAADTVNADTTLYAKWKINSYTVTFNANGGKFSDDSTTKTENVEHNAKTTAPDPSPTKDGVLFLGWHSTATNQNDNNVYNFNSPVTVAIEIHARWSDPADTIYTVSFDGASGIADQKILSGGVAKKPSDPQLTGKIFAGWYFDSTLSIEYDFTTEVIGTFTLYAKWLDVPTGLSIVQDTVGAWYSTIIVNGANTLDEVNILILAVNAVYPGFLGDSLGY